MKLASCKNCEIYVYAKLSAYQIKIYFTYRKTASLFHLDHSSGLNNNHLQAQYYLPNNKLLKQQTEPKRKEIYRQKPQKVNLV